MTFSQFQRTLFAFIRYHCSKTSINMVESPTLFRFLFKKASLVAGCLLLGGQVFSQKIEVEKQIRREQFPAQALQWLEKEYPSLRRDRYFREYEADTINFEAKFCWEKAWYSVEFLENGSLKDIEKQVDFSSIPAEERDKMAQHLDADFKKWKVSRCQEQVRPGQPGKRYEIEIKGRDATGAVKYEYLFEQSGILVQKQQIILPSNLINQY
jgi:hypothetical protein